MSQIDVWHHSGRRNPATGVLISRDRPTIVFLTVCTLGRSATLAQEIYHDALVQAWTEANAWLVGAYVIMPDHIHLFCAPKNEEITIEQWIAFWKRQFRRKVGPAAPRFQSRGFHHRLRRDENYHHKWEYVRANPVRAGLVKKAEEWKYQGALNHLPWYGDAHPSGSSAPVRLRSGQAESRPTSISTTPLEAAVSAPSQAHVIRHLARGSGAKAGHPRFDLPLIRAICGIRGRLLPYRLVPSPTTAAREPAQGELSIAFSFLFFENFAPPLPEKEVRDENAQKRVKK